MMSLLNGIFPNPFKQAIVSPLLKKSTLSKEDLKSYRTVSGFSFLSKLVEHIVATKLDPTWILMILETLFSQPISWATQQKLLCCASKMRFIYLCQRACLQHWCCSTCPQSLILLIMTHSFPVCRLGLALLVPY